jgi:hypothetical protein
MPKGQVRLQTRNSEERAGPELLWSLLCLRERLEGRRKHQQLQPDELLRSNREGKTQKADRRNWLQKYKASSWKEVCSQGGEILLRNLGGKAWKMGF